MASNAYDYYKFLCVPNGLNDILGNNTAIAAMKRFAESFAKGERVQPLLLYGPSGVGKTAAAYLLAKEFKWNVAEMSASDYRDKETMEKRLLPASLSRSLFGSLNLIVIDEVDEMASKFDSGSDSSLLKLIHEAKNPIVFIAEDMWSQDIAFLRGKVNAIRFMPISQQDVAIILKNILASLGAAAPSAIVEGIAMRSKGDVRSAINDLYACMGAEQGALEVVGIRDKKIDIFNTLDKIFMANTMSAPIRAVAASDVQNEMLMQWIDENIPRRYINLKDLASALFYLSLATRYYNIASKRQYYTYWRYMNVMMSSGVALSKSEYPNTARRYEFPQNIKRLSITKASRKREVEISEILQSIIHAGSDRIISNELLLIGAMIKKCVSLGESAEDVAKSLEIVYKMDEKMANVLIKHFIPLPSKDI